MKTSPHIVIVGAGLIGLSTADALIRRGARVTVIESRSEPMQGASHANSGMIHPSQACSWSDSSNDPDVDAAVFGLACQSWGLMQARMQALGLNAMRDRPAGCYQLFDDVDSAQAAKARLQARGIRVQSRDANDSRFAMPALYFPDDHSGDAYVYGQALVDAFVRMGGSLKCGVLDVSLSESDDGRVTLSVSRQTIAADHVVIATGVGSPGLLEPLNMDLSITAVRGWAADFALPRGANLPLEPVMDARSRSALTVFDEVFRLSGTWGEAAIDPLLDRWADIMPEVMQQSGDPVRTWSGQRPVSPLGRPFIGRGRHPNLWINTGHGHMGWTLCGGSGDLLARMILDGAVDTRFRIPSA